MSHGVYSTLAASEGSGSDATARREGLAGRRRRRRRAELGLGTEVGKGRTEEEGVGIEMTPNIW